MEAIKKMTVLPNPMAPFDEKLTDSYGLAVAKVIAGDWFGGGLITSGCQFMDRREYVRRKRLFVRGEHDASYFKNQMKKGDGDLDLINLDWSNINWAEKFCRIVSNGISDKNYKLDVRATDKLSAIKMGKKQDYYLKHMKSKNMLTKAKDLLGIDMMPADIPADEEEMKLWLQIKDRPKIEIAEEILIDYVLKTHDWDVLSGMYDKDIVDVGLMVARVYIDKNDGVKVSYVDSENYIHSTVSRNDFHDKYYEGVVDTITASDLRRESGWDDATLRKVCKAYGTMNNSTIRDFDSCGIDEIIDFKIDVLRFAYKTSKTITFRKKLRKGEAIKVSRRKDTFVAPERADVEVLSKTLDTWMEGSYVIGTDFLYEYKECENVFSDVMNKAVSPFITMAYDLYENRLRSFTDNIEAPARQLQQIHLTIQRLIKELKPDLINVDLDMLAELGDGKGGNKEGDWKMALQLMDAKGVVFSKRVDTPESGVKDRPAASPMSQQQGSALAPLLNTWAHYYNLIRENTGVNPARDGSLPADALVGVNQMAQLASNTVTANIVEASVLFKKKIMETISTRLHTIFKYKDAGPIREVYSNVVGKTMLDALEVLKDRHLHEFGFTFEMYPTAEDLKEFNESLNLAIQSQSIDLDVVFTARQIARTSTKLALEYLRYYRRKRLEEEQKARAQDAQIKSQMDAQAAQASSQAETQSYGEKKQIDLQFAQRLSQIKVAEAQALQQIQQPLADKEFEQEVYLKKIETAAQLQKTTYQEDRKDDRTAIQASQQSKMKEQAQKNGTAIDFENPSTWFENEDI